MLAVVNKSDNFVVVYLDDIMIFRDQLDIVWKVAIWVIAKLTAMGFMINIKKAQFSVQGSTNAWVYYRQW